MAKRVIIKLFFALAVISCTGQNKNETNIPKTNIKVTKEYDKNGNLTRLDSTYTYFYSSSKNDLALDDAFKDELKQKFNLQFKSIDSLFKKDYFLNDFFQQDDFFGKNFFEENFNHNHKEIEKIMKKLDSLRLNFKNNHVQIKELDNKRI